jgi:predicted PurR-regulated permease PerM
VANNLEARATLEASVPAPEILSDERFETVNRHLRGIRRRALILVIVALIGAAYFARDFLLPIMLAFLLALTLSPIVRYLQRRGIPATVTALALVGALIAVIILGAVFLSGPVSHWLDIAPEAGQQLSSKLSALRSGVQAAVEASKQVENLTESGSSGTVQKVVIDQPGLLSRAADTLLSTATTLGITIVLLLFLLSSGTLFYEKMIAILPTLHDKKRALRIAYDVEHDVSRYLLTITVINIVFGCAVGGGLAVAGMPNPALWGVVAGLLNFVPYVGALTGLATVALVAILSFDTIGQAILPPLIYVMLHVLEGQFITPIILGRRLELNAVAIFIALAFWTWLWGIVGAILAVPVLVCVKVFCDHFDGLNALGEFLSASPPAAPQEKAEANGTRHVPAE